MAAQTTPALSQGALRARMRGNLPIPPCWLHVRSLRTCSAVLIPTQPPPTSARTSEQGKARTSSSTWFGVGHAQPVSLSRWPCSCVSVCILTCPLSCTPFLPVFPDGPPAPPCPVLVPSPVSLSHRFPGPCLSPLCVPLTGPPLPPCPYPPPPPTRVARALLVHHHVLTLVFVSSSLTLPCSLVPTLLLLLQLVRPGPCLTTTILSSWTKFIHGLAARRH